MKEPASSFDEFRWLVGDLKSALQASLQEFKESELRPLREEVEDRGRKLNVAISRSARTAGQEYHALSHELSVVVTAAYVEARISLRNVTETELRPLQDALDPEGRVADRAKAARRLIGRTGSRLHTLADKHISGKPGSLSLRAVWRSLKQAKDLVFTGGSRSRQFDEMSDPADGTARSQIAQAELAVNRYLKVAAASVAVATVGTLLLPPLKLVSGGLILYSAIPVFKGAYTDVVTNRRMSIKVLDSVSFLGLLAGGYFFICSLTATVFHASTKMMLKTEDQSRQMIANMFGEQPQTVWVVIEGTEIEIPFELLTAGDVLVVHAGQMIPVDGVIATGTASVDQHVLTGESQPAEKGVGDEVFAATIVLAGRIEVQVQKTGSETAAAQIREILANTTDFRTSLQARWRNVGDKTVWPTLGLAGLALAVLNPISALAVVNSNYVSVMKVCSPLAMLNFLQRASQSGILIKDGRALELAYKIDTVVFDKTGTLTENQPNVGQLFVCAGVSEDDLLSAAAAVEAKQTHPIAQAILGAAKARNLALPPLDEERYEMGYGIQARVGTRLVRVGSARYMAMEGIALPTDLEARLQALQTQGSSVVLVAFETELAGAIELRPTLRPEAKQIVQELRQRGLTPYIISGDHAAPTQALAAELGIDRYFAEVLPQDKSRLVEALQKEGRRVCFVGDGINDAIALKKADVSVSLRGASSLATNTAQIILMNEGLKQFGLLFEVASDYDANLRTLMGTTFAPGFVSLAGVFFLGTGNAVALTLFNLSMLAGLVNGIWPALQQQLANEAVVEEVP